MTSLTPEQLMAKLKEIDEAKQAEQRLRDEMANAEDEGVTVLVPMSHFTSMQERRP